MIPLHSCYFLDFTMKVLIFNQFFYSFMLYLENDSMRKKIIRKDSFCVTKRELKRKLNEITKQLLKLHK